MAVFKLVLLLMIAQATMSELEQKGDKLKLSVYYESLCPDCIEFITYQLAPTLDMLKKHQHVMSLDLVPFGKVQKVGDKWYCQHGPRECAGNKLEACAIDQLVTTRPNPLQHDLINFISCTSASQLQDPLQDAQQCSEETGVNMELLMECFNGTRGAELMQEHANRTNALQPALSWVPTIVINNFLAPETHAYSIDEFLNWKQQPISNPEIPNT